MGSSIYDLLMGKSEQQYLAEDPFFRSGFGVSQGSGVAPRTNSEALLIPLLEGLAGGAMQGFGRSQARKTAYEDYKKNPLVSMLEGPALPEQMPSGWNINDGQQDLIFKALQKQNADDIAQKEAEYAAKFASEYSPQAMAAKAQLAGMESGASEAAKLGAQRGGPALLPKDLANLEVDYTTKLTTGPSAQNIQEVETRGAQVLNAIKTRDPLHAAAAIYGMAKVLDPAGVVRKEDGTIVANPGGPAGQLASLANQIMQKGQLTDDTVKAMRKLVPELVKGQYSTYAKQKDAMIAAATKQGAIADNIGFLPEPSFAEALKPSPQEMIARLKKSGATPEQARQIMKTEYGIE
jgi:hypothetical protein